MITPDHIKSILKRVPTDPGVYQYFDKDRKILYVGKAKNLKNRVLSYFNRNKYDRSKTKRLVAQIDHIEFIVVETELDALLLENSLIKKYKPRYNIQLKDDKSYPSIVIKNERFPRIHSVHHVAKDKSEYFGPYASYKTMYTVLDLIKKMYPLRTCNYHLSKENIAKKKYKVCLEYHLGNCKGPCEGLEEEEDYTEHIDSIRKILKGNMYSLVQEMKGVMKGHAENLEFEEAQNVKEKITALENYQAKSAVVNHNISDVDVFSIVSDTKSGYVNYFKIKEGSIVHSLSTEIKKSMEESDEDLLTHGIINLREKFPSQSKEIYIPFDLNLEIPGVKFYVPKIGDKKKLMVLSERNAKYFMRDKHKQLEQIDPEAHQKRILGTLKADLRLTETPIHIECFDNSNIQGTNPTSACVVFKNAKPSKKDYRKFNIKTVVGPDDFASMEEVVYRRYKRLVEEEQSLPQLIIIDGGKGQLSSAMKSIDALGLRGKIAVIGIAKKLEEIFFPGDSLPLYIDKRSESLKLIQQLRNEAHRFSLFHHRDRRSKEALQTELIDIDGVGMRTAQALLWEFKSVKNIAQASMTELRKAANQKVALNVFKHFNPDA